MTVLILAAGYATRLYPLTLNTPKPLLQVGNKTILGHIFAKISGLPDVKKCFIITNQKFFETFKKWAADLKFSVPIEVINDGTLSNETRLGAIRDIEYVIGKKGIDDDLLVIGGDNLFEFDLKDFADFAKSRAPSASLALFDIGDKEKAKIYGVAKIDGGACVTDFKEKPSEPESTLIATCVYYFFKEKLPLLLKYLALGKGMDAPGNYIKWLSENDAVYGFVFKGAWYDIGDKKSLEEADRKYNEKTKKRKNGGTKEP